MLDYRNRTTPPPALEPPTLEPPPLVARPLVLETPEPPPLEHDINGGANGDWRSTVTPWLWLVPGIIMSIIAICKK